MKYDMIRDARKAADDLDEIMSKILDREISPEQGASFANKIINKNRRQKKPWQGIIVA